MRNMSECRYRSNSGGWLKSLNTALPRWWPFKWDIRFVVLKLDAFFPPLGILAEHALEITMALSSSATEKNFQTDEDMFTNYERNTSWESLQFKAAVTCTRKADESQINLTDWLIYQQAYFIRCRYRISFIYRSNTNEVIITHISR